MKKLKLLIIFSAAILFESCGPSFKTDTLQKEIESVTKPVTLKAGTNLSSGGSSPIATSAGYKVTNSVGTLSTAVPTKTAAGYSVVSSLTSDQ